MGATVRVLRVSLGDGLHGGGVEPAAGAVATAVGHRGDARAALPGCRRHGQRLRGEALGVGPGEEPRDLDGLQAGDGGPLLPESARRLVGRLWATRPPLQGVSGGLGGNGALEDLGG